MKVTYHIGEDTIENDLQGDIHAGEQKVLLLQDENLLDATPWNEEGFTVQPFLSEEEFKAVKNGITQLVRQTMSDLGIDAPESFRLIDYHKYVNDDQHLHLAKAIQLGWRVSHFPIDFGTVNRRMSELLGKEVNTKAWNSDFDNFFLRIVRPNKLRDNNPPHRDVWIDRLRNAVNIYAPLCGSNPRSALPILPKSHLLPESSIERTVEGALLNGTRYTVPCVIAVNGEEPRMIRPNPKENEMLIFSPYLVHGGGYNLNEDETRVSLEIRFFLKR